MKLKITITPDDNEVLYFKNRELSEFKELKTYENIAENKKIYLESTLIDIKESIKYLSIMKVKNDD